MHKMKNRKKSKYSGKKYKRYRKGFWRRYKGQRKWNYSRCILEVKRLLDDKPDPCKVRPPHTVGRPPANPKDILILDLKRSFCNSSLENAGLLAPATTEIEVHKSIATSVIVIVFLYTLFIFIFDYL